MRLPTIAVLVGIVIGCAGHEDEIGEVVRATYANCVNGNANDCPVPPGSCARPLCEGFLCFQSVDPFNCVCATDDDCDDGNSCTNDVCDLTVTPHRCKQPTGGDGSGEGCCSATHMCPPPNSCQNPPSCFNKTCGYTGKAAPGCCNIDSQCTGGATCVENNCILAGSSADVGITLVDSPDPVTVGDNVTYTITVTDNGPDDATGVSITYPLPSGTTLVSKDPACTGTTTLTCPVGTLLDGHASSFAVTVKTTVTGSLSSTATVASDADQAPANNSATARTTVGAAAAAKLTLSTVDSPDPVQRGQKLTWTFTVGNTGSAAAAATQVKVTLPAGVTYDAPAATQGTCTKTSTTVTCMLGSLAKGANAGVTVSGTVDVTGPATLTIKGEASSPDASTVMDTETTVVEAPPVPDVSLSAASSVGQLEAGKVVTFTLTVTVTGATAKNVKVVLDPLTGPGTLGACAGCVLGDLAPGTVTVTVTAIGNAPGTLVLKAHVDSNPVDAPTTNNDAMAMTMVVDAPPPPEVSMTMTGPAKVAGDAAIDYVVTVAASGASSATGVKVVIELPEGAGGVVSAPGCTAGGTTLTCDFGTVTPSTPVARTVTLRPSGLGPLTRGASARSDEDGDGGSATVTTLVEGPDLGVVIVPPSSAFVGTTGALRVTVANESAFAATGATLALRLPPNATSMTTPSGVTCTGPVTQLACAIASLAAHASVSLDFSLDYTSAGALDPEASVSGAYDPVGANNHDSAHIVVDGPRTDLAATLFGGPPGTPPFQHGEAFSVTATIRNDGPSRGAGAALTVAFGADAEISDVAGCTLAGLTLVCPPGALGVGESRSYVIQIRPLHVGPFDVTASASTSDLDTNPANDTATLPTVDVKPTADLFVDVMLFDPKMPDTLESQSPAIRNLGPDDATDVIVTIAVASGMVAVSGYTARFLGGDACVAGVVPDTVDCKLAHLAAGASVNLIFSGLSPGLYNAHVEAKSPVHDPMIPNKGDQTLVVAKDGCTCRVGDSGQPRGAAPIVLAALGLIALRRRQRRPKVFIQR